MGAKKIFKINKKRKDYHKKIIFPAFALCNQSKELVESHVISKMFFRWIKKSTKRNVPRFRTIDDKIIQDGYKIYLLCADCEQYFSRFETYFNSNVYRLTIKNIKISIDYDIKLIKFIVSLGWRFLHVYLKQKPNSPTYLKWYEKHWKEFLIDKSKNLFTNHYLIPSNFQIDDEYINDYLELFIYLSVGYGLSAFDNYEFIWIQIPFYTLLFPLRPMILRGYDTCKILRQGILKINYPQIINQNEFSLAVFILEKCKELSNIYDIDDKYRGNVFFD